MAQDCNHPIDKLRYTGSSTEDAGIGYRWPTKVYWYECSECGAEIFREKPITEYDLEDE